MYLVPGMFQGAAVPGSQCKSFGIHSSVGTILLIVFAARILVSGAFSFSENIKKKLPVMYRCIMNNKYHIMCFFLPPPPSFSLAIFPVSPII